MNAPATPSSTACSARPSMTCPGPATATARSRRSATSFAPRGKRPFFVPYGVSNPLGAIAYASTIVEIAEQSRASGFEPAAIVHCSGSAGTQAGLVVGAALALQGTRIVGIDIDAEPERVRADVIAYAKAAAELLGSGFSEADVEVVAGHAGPAYGVPHAATIEAIRLGGQLEALALDPVYSGKGLAGLIALVREGRWRADEDVVFIHTGGAPALFAYSICSTKAPPAAVSGRRSRRSADAATTCWSLRLLASAIPSSRRATSASLAGVVADAWSGDSLGDVVRRVEVAEQRTRGRPSRLPPQAGTRKPTLLLASAALLRTTAYQGACLRGA